VVQGEPRQTGRLRSVRERRWSDGGPGFRVSACSLGRYPPRSLRESASRSRVAGVKYAVLVVVGVTTGFLIARFLVPFVLKLGGGMFLVLPILLVATLLLARALRRGRAGS
jgi:hypothetical protein